MENTYERSLYLCGKAMCIYKMLALTKHRGTNFYTAPGNSWLLIIPRIFVLVNRLFSIHLIPSGSNSLPVFFTGWRKHCPNHYQQHCSKYNIPFCCHLRYTSLLSQGPCSKQPAGNLSLYHISAVIPSLLVVNLDLSNGMSLGLPQQRF